MQSTVATPRSGRGEGHPLDLDREAAGVVADEDQDRLPVAFLGAADGTGGDRVPTGLRVFAPVSPDERRVVADQGRCGPRRGGWPGLPMATGPICRSARRGCPYRLVSALPRAASSAWVGTANAKDSPNFALTAAGPLDLREELGSLPANGASRRCATSMCTRIRGDPRPSSCVRRDQTVAMTSTGSDFKRWVFSRHSHPWSAWTRWASTPLVLLPVWNRSPRQGVVVAAWLALNPVLFPPPRDDSAFATRAVLGEERWLEERPVSGALAINCMASAALLIAIDSARRHRRRQMTIATIATMGALLWYWREMVRFYDTRGDGQ